MSEEFDISKEINKLQCSIRKIKKSIANNQTKQNDPNISDMKRKELMLDLEHMQKKVAMRGLFLEELKNKKYS